MNSFQNDYVTRLKDWNNLREKLKDSDLLTKCVEIDKFWQFCPLNNHYLHPIDIDTWPNPWELIYENNYCPYARALGIIYTLYMLGVRNLDLVDGIDDNDISVVLVLVENAKYILNYWPDTVVNNDLHDFNIKKYYDISSLYNKIGQT